MPTTEIEPADDGTTLDDLQILPPGSAPVANAYTIRLFDKGCFSSFGVKLMPEERQERGPLPDGLFCAVARPKRWKNCMHRRELQATKCMVCAAFGRLTTA